MTGAPFVPVPAKLLSLIALELIDVADQERALARYFEEAPQQDAFTRAVSESYNRSAELLEKLERRIVEECMGAAGER